MQRKKYPADFKAKVALEAIRETRTTAELCSQYDVHVTMLGRWRQQAIEHIRTGFSEKTEKQDKNNEQVMGTLYQQIGQLISTYLNERIFESAWTDAAEHSTTS